MAEVETVMGDGGGFLDSPQKKPRPLRRMPHKSSISNESSSMKRILSDEMRYQARWRGTNCPNSLCQVSIPTRDGGPDIISQGHFAIQILSSVEDSFCPIIAACTPHMGSTFSCYRRNLVGLYTPQLCLETDPTECVKFAANSLGLVEPVKGDVEVQCENRETAPQQYSRSRGYLDRREEFMTVYGARPLTLNIMGNLIFTFGCELSVEDFSRINVSIAIAEVDRALLTADSRIESFLLAEFNRFVNDDAVRASGFLRKILPRLKHAVSDCVTVHHAGNNAISLPAVSGRCTSLPYSSVMEMSDELLFQRLMLYLIGGMEIMLGGFLRNKRLNGAVARTLDPPVVNVAEVGRPPRLRVRVEPVLFNDSASDSTTASSSNSSTSVKDVSIERVVRIIRDKDLRRLLHRQFLDEDCAFVRSILENPVQIKKGLITYLVSKKTLVIPSNEVPQAQKQVSEESKQIKVFEAVGLHAETERNVSINTDIGIPMTNCTLGKETFRFPTKYIVKSVIGRGYYGVVFSGHLRQSEERVAIKMLVNVGKNARSLKSALREVRILRHMNHENIISIRDVFVIGSKSAYNDVYVVMELLWADLTTLVNSGIPLDDITVQYLAYQIIRGLKYVHSAGVIHRDLKSRNCLIQSTSDLKICDFGLARVVNASTPKESALPVTPRLCTRWYRPPEILCKSRNYTAKVDMWSAGCILAELLRRCPLFPGHNSFHQLALILRLLGAPSERDIEDTVHCTCRYFVRKLIGCVNSDYQENEGFDSLFPNTPAASLNVLQALLCFNPRDRPTASEALQNPYFASLHNPNSEPTRDLLPLSEFEFERRIFTYPAFREELFREVLQYYPDKREEYFAQMAQQPEFLEVESCRLLNRDDFPDSDEFSFDSDHGF